MHNNNGEETCILSFLSRYKASVKPRVGVSCISLIYFNILSTMPASPPTLSTNQLDLYLQRIKYGHNTAASHNDSSCVEHLKDSVKQNPLAALTDLQRLHLASIPWGNSALHYSKHHSISVDPTSVFEKLVVRRRDGYCMENTNLFYTVLRSLGYQVYPAGGRVSRTVTTGNSADEGYICL